ncbi:hypothetical protein ABVK25_012399 [Lepraria finkii]|uniref:Uncharacterized protein n=1 Tax=Lepraria finkii TaxID=1340010 RepID=A0ABR4AGA5_9LECA
MLVKQDIEVGKVVFLRSPPPPFGCDFTRSERRSDDEDEDWLPDLRDIFSGDFYEMIDLTCDLESEHEEGQEWEGNSGGGGRGGFPPSREPDAPSPASTTQLLESGTDTERQSQETVHAHLRIRSASRVVSLAREVMRSHSESHVSVQDITFLHIEGQRETARGPEYLCVGKMWFKADAGVLSDLLQTYRKEIARNARLATLRNRKRMGEEVEAVQATRRKTVK